MAQSEYHYGSERSEVSSTISAKTTVQKGYARKGKTQLQKVEEEELAKKWEEENKKLRQLSRESSRRLAKIRKKEAEERLKAVKEQDEALKHKKLIRDQYYVHNIRKQVEKKPTQKKPASKPDYKAVLHQKPIGCQRITKPPKAMGSGRGKVEKDKLKQVNEVRLEDFLQPSSNLNGLDLDVRGSMQLTMRKLGVKDDSTMNQMKQSDLLDSLDLQIAAIIEDKKVNEVVHNDSLEEAQEIPEEIKDEAQDENEQLNNIEQNWKKVNNNLRKEEQLRKITPGSNSQEPIKQFNKIIPLSKEVNSTLPKQPEVLVDSMLSDSLAPKGIPESKNIVDLSQSTEMAKLFGVNFANDSLEASAFNWVKKNPELVKNMKELEPKVEVTKPPLKPEPIRTAIEKAIQKEPEPHNELTFKEPLHKLNTPKEHIPSKKEEKKATKRVEQNSHNLRADNLSQMAPKPIQKKGGPKSRATTVFTHEDDFDVDEFIMVLFKLII
jgi:hypothetical protein